ncbi:MAG: putative transrane protein of unknown function [Bacteroidetes bacterium]|jgi:uncharacterized membrane protein|nr:putative transrane protein of unknown function [Bacteroidota bacterium]MDF2451620.1 putative transrane protein of unknown function [Bacteroidota bacterium]
MNQQEQEDEMYRDPDNWKLGIFYFCPQDSRLFVPKKISLFGITPNFANPKAYLIIFAFIAIMVFASK